MKAKWPASLDYTRPHIDVLNAMPDALRDQFRGTAQKVAAGGSVLAIAASAALLLSGVLDQIGLMAVPVLLAVVVGGWLGASKLGGWIGYRQQLRATARYLETGKWS